jgi:hypothetical protein
VSGDEQAASLANHQLEGMVRSLRLGQMLAAMKRLLVCLSANDRSAATMGIGAIPQERTPYEQRPTRSVSLP